MSLVRQLRAEETSGYSLLAEALSKCLKWVDSLSRWKASQMTIGQRLLWCPYLSSLTDESLPGITTTFEYRPALVRSLCSISTRHAMARALTVFYRFWMRRDARLHRRMIIISTKIPT